MKILAIGNSVSVDALTYLEGIARAAGAEVTLGNLYIGGCSLEMHDRNIRESAPDYTYFKTGCEPRPITVEEALLDEDWDHVTLQQASHFSGKWDTYEPYLTRVSGFARSLRPDARQWIHETWAYEIGSSHPAFPDYGCDQAAMYRALRDCYHKAARLIGAGFIPSGDAMQIARSLPPFDTAHGGISLCRDGFHASLARGRYLLGCVWLEAVLGMACAGNPFVPEDPASPQDTPTREEMRLLQESAHLAVRQSLS